MPLPEDYQRRLSDFQLSIEIEYSNAKDSLKELKEKKGSISTPSGERQVEERNDLGRLNSSIHSALSDINYVVEIIEHFDFEGKAVLLNEVGKIATELDNMIKEQGIFFEEELNSNLIHRNAFDAAEDKNEAVNEFLQDSILLKDLVEEMTFLHEQSKDKLDELQTKKDSISTKTGEKRVLTDKDFKSLNEFIKAEIGFISKTLVKLDDAGVKKHSQIFEQIKTIFYKLKEIREEQKGLFIEKLQSNSTLREEFLSESLRVMNIDSRYFEEGYPVHDELFNARRMRVEDREIMDWKKEK